jgi:hypothetical protein
MRVPTTLICLALFALPVVVPAQSPAIPTPESALGFQPGADFKLANYEQVVTYFQKVDAASDRVMMVEAGKSSQGRPYYFALVSSAENLRQVDHYREIAQRLAHPQGLTDADARRLAARAKRSFTSMGDCTQAKWQVRNTSRNCCTTS